MPPSAKPSRRTPSNLPRSAASPQRRDEREDPRGTFRAARFRVARVGPGLTCGGGRDRLVARRGSCHPLAGAAGSHGGLARRGRCRASARRARGLGRPPPGARGCRRVVGGRRLLPGGLHRRRTRATLDRDDAHAADPADPRARPGVGGGPPRGPARRRARALGARRSAVLRRRGRAVHQRPDDRDRRLLRGGRRRDRRADPRRAARRRRLELRGRERVGALLVRHDDQRARRAARVRARDRRLGRGAARPDAAGSSTCSSGACSVARARARSSIRRISTSRSRTTGATTCCAHSTTSAARARTRIPGWRRLSRRCGPSSSPTAGGCSTASIRVASTSTSRMASARPVGGTASAPFGCSTGGTEWHEAWLRRAGAGTMGNPTIRVPAFDIDPGAAGERGTQIQGLSTESTSVLSR